MSQTFNIYCDESCHLEHDRKPVMVIGGVWCPAAEVKNITRQIRVIKEMHHARGEIKWNRVSRSRQDFFIELVKYFFQTNLGTLIPSLQKIPYFVCVMLDSDAIGVTSRSLTNICAFVEKNINCRVVLYVTIGAALAIAIVGLFLKDPQNK